MKIKRKIESEIQKELKVYKILTLTGPRQAGKTTLCKSLFPEKKYYSLEDPDIRNWCTEDPRSFLNEIKMGAVLDEIQRAPDFLSYLQTFVDGQKSNGLFILTGSNQLQLNEKITQSLAGRTSLATLLPFSISEIKDLTIKDSFSKIAYRGFYPGLYENEISPSLFYKNYYQTYVERDVTSLIQLKERMNFEKFVKLCAGRAAQILDYSNLANDVGVSVTTIKNWISILEASYILFRLPPYFENFSKRMIKSPKLYFYDVGLLSYLLDIRSENELDNHSMRGNIFENMAIVDLMKEFYYTGRDTKLYFLRDSKGNEVDLVYKLKEKFHLLEIKSGMTLNDDFYKGLKYYTAFFEEKKIKSKSYLIYSGEQEQSRSYAEIMNFKSLEKLST
jgi:predicted AAA+ superfamily ATPase